MNDKSRLLVYLNHGTQTQYVFTDSSEIKAGNAVINYRDTYLHMFDLNRDGKKDLLVGRRDSSDNKIYFFQNSGTDKEPLLSNGVPLLKIDNTPIKPLNATQICFDVTDWNEDGYPDILITDYVPKGNYLVDILVKLYTGQPQTGIQVKNDKKRIFTVKQYWDSKNKKLVLTFPSNGNDCFACKVFSINGKIVRECKSQISSHSTLNLDLSDCSTGLYIVYSSVGNNTYCNHVVVE